MCGSCASPISPHSALARVHQNSLLSLSEYCFVQLVEYIDTGEFTVLEPFLFVDRRHGKAVQSLSSLMPLTPVQPRNFRIICSFQMVPFYFGNVSTNFFHIIWENPAKKNSAEIRLPRLLHTPSRHQDNKMDYVLSMPYFLPSQPCYHSEKARSLWL